MDQEERFLQVFFKVNHYSVTVGELVLSDGATANQLKYVPFKPTHLPLEGTNWVLSGFTESISVTRGSWLFACTQLGI